MKSASAPIGADSGFGNEAKIFTELSKGIASQAAAEGLSIVPFRDPSLPFFAQLPLPEKRAVLQKLETMLSIGERLRGLDQSVLSAKTSVWGFAQHARMTFPPDLLDRLGERDLVDVYNVDHKMIFANLRFFEVVSYSLEDLYCRPWTDLFTRNRPQVQEQLWELSQAMVSEVHRGIVPTDYIQTNITIEMASPEGRRILARPRFFAPLFSGGKVAAYLCANSAAII